MPVFSWIKCCWRSFLIQWLSPTFLFVLSMLRWALHIGKFSQGFLKFSELMSQVILLRSESLTVYQPPSSNLWITLSSLLLGASGKQHRQVIKQILQENRKKWQNWGEMLRSRYETASMKIKSQQQKMNFWGITFQTLFQPSQKVRGEFWK